MLDALIRRQEIDILLIQEAIYHVLNDFQGYTTQYTSNIGANRRVTAIVARDGINLENIRSNYESVWTRYGSQIRRELDN